MSDQESKIYHVFKTYKAAVYQKDSNTLCALYTDDVKVYDMWIKGCYSGKAEWAPVIENWLFSLGTETVEVDFSDIDIKVDLHLAVATAFVYYKAMNAEGAELRKMKNRLTWNLININDTWLVFHQHTSAPINTSTQAIFMF